jgi:hypothetical protein
MILICDVNVVASPDVVAYLDTKMADNSAAPTNQATVTNTHDRISNAFLPWNHSG